MMKPILWLLVVVYFLSLLPGCGSSGRQPTKLSPLPPASDHHKGPPREKKRL
jgi:hypothetical protein